MKTIRKVLKKLEWSGTPSYYSGNGWAQHEGWGTQPTCGFCQAVKAKPLLMDKKIAGQGKHLGSCLWLRAWKEAE